MKGALLWQRRGTWPRRIWLRAAQPQSWRQPTDGDNDERIPAGQLLGYAPLIYTAEFPLNSLSALRQVKGVYWRHHMPAE